MFQKIKLLLAALLFSSITAASAIEPSPSQTNLTIVFEALIPELLEKHNVNGLSITLISPDQKIWSRGFGLADVERKVPVTSTTVFQAASISKSITALGVLILAEEGKINLDAPVETYLTRWRLPPSPFNHDDVTVRRILNHTAGLSVRSYFGFHPEEKLPTLEETLNGKIGGRGLKGFIANEIANRYEDVRVVQKPGLETRYSGGGYTLLQLLIEEVTGQSFSSVIKEKVLTPLKMHSSSYDWEPHLQARTAIPYEGTFFKAASPLYQYRAQAAASLYSTTPDLALFAVSLMDASTTSLISIKARRDMLAQSLGIWPSIVGDDVLLVEHEGYNLGSWRSIYAILPEQNQALIIMTNGDNGEEVYGKLKQLWLLDAVPITGPQ